MLHQQLRPLIAFTAACTQPEADLLYAYAYCLRARQDLGRIYSYVHMYKQLNEQGIFKELY